MAVSLSATDYRRLWFGKGSGVAGSGCGLGIFRAVRRPVHRTAEPLVCASALGIRLSDQPDHRDQRFQGYSVPILYRIEPAKEPGRSRIRLEPQFWKTEAAAGTFQFDIDGEALDMRRLDEKSLSLWTGRRRQHRCLFAGRQISVEYWRKVCRFTAVTIIFMKISAAEKRKHEIMKILVLGGTRFSEFIW